MYLGVAALTEEKRIAVRTPGTASRSGTCSLSYQALNSSSTFAGGCIRTKRKPFRPMHYPFDTFPGPVGVPLWRKTAY